MFKKPIVLLVIFLLLLPLGAYAQNEPEMASVLVDLWPEYDQPSMLVIYHLTISPQSNLPLEVQLRIPSDAGAPHAVAVRQPDGSLISVPYTMKVEGDWTRIIFQATAPEVQIEFYDPNLVINGSERSYEYTWPGDYSVGSFAIEVQRPAGAEGLQVKPGMIGAKQGSDGLTYYNMNVGSLSKGQEFKITLTYSKESDVLSVSNLPVEPSAPLEGSTPVSASLASLLPWILGFLGLVLIIGGGIWYWQSGRQKSLPRKENRKRRRSASPTVTSDDSEASFIYCHQCGKRASSGDRFCRTCGTPLRIN